MAEPIRVAGIGCGYFSQFQYAAWRRLPVELLAVADCKLAQAETCASRFSIARAYDDVETMLEAENPDLIDIVTPPPSHLQLIEAAAARGIDVICQKPFTRNLEQARRAIKTAEAAGIRLVVHENFRFQPWYREIARQLATGRLGTIYSVEFRLRPGDGQGEDAYLERQPGFRQMPKFLVNETAVHLVDVFRFLFGNVHAVYAELRRLNPVIEGEDAGRVLLDLDAGVHALFDGNRLADHAAGNRRLTMGELRVEGSNGELTLDGNGIIRLRRFGENESQALDYSWDDIDFGGDCVYLTQKHVIDHLVDGRPLENTAADYIANLEIVDAIYRSAELGHRIELTPKQA